MRRVGDKLAHAHGGEGVIHLFPNFLRGHAQVLRGKGHVLLHHIGNNLVIRVLEHHAHPLADRQKQSLIRGIHSLYINLAAGGQQHRVEGLGQGGLSGAIMPQHHHKAALFNLHVYTVQGQDRGLPFLCRIGKAQLICLNHGCHSVSLFPRQISAWPVTR